MFLFLPVRGMMVIDVTCCVVLFFYRCSVGTCSASGDLFWAVFAAMPASGGGDGGRRLHSDDDGILLWYMV